MRQPCLRQAQFLQMQTGMQSGENLTTKPEKRRICFDISSDPGFAGLYNVKK